MKQKTKYSSRAAAMLCFTSYEALP